MIIFPGDRARRGYSLPKRTSGTRACDPPHEATRKCPTSRCSTWTTLRRSAAVMLNSLADSLTWATLAASCAIASRSRATRVWDLYYDFTDSKHRRCPGTPPHAASGPAQGPLRVREDSKPVITVVLPEEN
jgi:hypothetical protein